MIKQTVTLIGLPDGRCLWAELGRYYKSVATARAAVMRNAKRVARTYGKVMTMLEIY